MVQRDSETGGRGPQLQPVDVARELLESIERDMLTKAWKPEDPADVATAARWGGAWLLERKARRTAAAGARLEARRGNRREAAELQALADRPGPLRPVDMLRWVRLRVSPWPERWARLVETVREVEGKALAREVERLTECGSPWGRVVRLFWKGARGEFSRMYGLHRCKSRHCPHCGRRRQVQRSEDIQRVLAIAEEWGLGPENVRFTTLTIRNGKDIPTLREDLHRAWARIQRRRWWPRWVCCWFRGTECVTGEDGNWNVHLHLVLVLWSHRMSYANLWDEWETAVGERSQVDIDRLHSSKARDAHKRGGLAAAARYVTKYIGKGEELQNLRRGPGGLAHYASATRRLRAFACGGAAPLLRRLAGVLLPTWAPRVEGILEDAHLWRGMPPRRAEEIDPETGEAWPCDPPSPALDARERAQAVALAGPLLQLGGTVGTPCGPRMRWRRIGWTPVRGRFRTVKAHEAGEPLDALHALVNGGRWKVQEITDTLKDGRRVRFRVVLPAGRFAWRDVARKVWHRLAQDVGAWATRRREAFRAWADARLDPLERRNSTGLLLENLAQARAGAEREARRFDAELMEERRKDAADPELVAWLQAWREWLRRPIGRGGVRDTWAGDLAFEL